MNTETIDELDAHFGEGGQQDRQWRAAETTGEVERSLELSREDFQKVGRGANEAVKLDELIRETERKVEEETIRGENPHDAYEEEFQPNREVIAKKTLGQGER